ncbi:hypothetical protein EVAR_86045_1 [Eumeta japonica]|uniref:115 kDa protein in type-1 retrotransposable element R1DM n=1 Tax=Eumeta variegata TaxID=151549 RepID=A0A4C1UKP7_EUMVA|nr:hypothetical protein EVAR_86045_1 [Eumeta japonica]
MSAGIPAKPGGDCVNHILDSLLRELGKLGVYVQALTNDAVLIFSGQSTSSIEEEINRAPARVHCWGVRNKLRFAPSKTNSIVLTKKLKYDDLVVHMNGLARAAKATSPEFVRTIYIIMIEPIVLYASCVWAPARGKLGIRKILDAVQRSVAFKACQSYVTVFLNSALILSRLLPLDIESGLDI